MALVMILNFKFYNERSAELIKSRSHVTQIKIVNKEGKSI